MKLNFSTVRHAFSCYVLVPYLNLSQKHKSLMVINSFACSVFNKMCDAIIFLKNTISERCWEKSKIGEKTTEVENLRQVQLLKIKQKNQEAFEKEYYFGEARKGNANFNESKRIERMSIEVDLDSNGGVVRRGSTNFAEPTHRGIISKEVTLDRHGAVESVTPIRTEIAAGRTEIAAGRTEIAAVRTEIAAVFKSCFHSTESEPELKDFISDSVDTCIRRKRESALLSDRANLFPDRWTYLTMKHFYKKLVCLSNALPGEGFKKTVKIYWDDQVETVLIPYLCSQDGPIENLVFSITPGEAIESKFQAENIDFSHQLQFVSTEKEKVFAELKSQIETLCLEVFGKDYFEEIERFAKTGQENPLLKTAQCYTRLRNVVHNLLSNVQNKEKSSLEKRTPEERAKFFEQLFSVNIDYKKKDKQAKLESYVRTKVIPSSKIALEKIPSNIKNLLNSIFKDNFALENLPVYPIILNEDGSCTKSEKMKNDVMIAVSRHDCIEISIKVNNTQRNCLVRLFADTRGDWFLTSRYSYFFNALDWRVTRDTALDYISFFKKDAEKPTYPDYVTMLQELLQNKKTIPVNTKDEWHLGSK
jgi:hypothetical protein